MWFSAKTIPSEIRSDSVWVLFFLQWSTDFAANKTASSLLSFWLCSSLQFLIFVFVVKEVMFLGHATCWSDLKLIKALSTTSPNIMQILTSTTVVVMCWIICYTHFVLCHCHWHPSVMAKACHSASRQRGAYGSGAGGCWVDSSMIWSNSAQSLQSCSAAPVAPQRSKLQ